MSQESTAVLERLLRSNNLGWALDTFGPRDRILPAWIAHLDQAAAQYHKRLGVHLSLAPEVLEAEAAKNPHKIRAFLQAFCTVSSPDMLVMVWRVLQGLGIREIKMAYRERDFFELTVVLERPGTYPGQSEVYQSQDIRDAAILRHLGTVSIDGKPFFHGFYTLRLGDKSATPETAAARSP